MDKVRIYIVEDEALIAMEISDRLSKLGYEVCGQAAHGEVALQEMPATQPDIVLMDIKLAGTLSGIDTANQLRPLVDVPIVFLSAFSDTQLVNEAISAGPFAYLVKPFDEHELHATLQSVYYKHRVERQRAYTNKLESQLCMAAGIVHDFNNLLQSIMGHLSLIQMKLHPPNNPIANNVKAALQAGHKAAEITRMLFIYTGKSPVKLAKNDLNEITTKSLPSLQALAGSTQAVQLHLSADIPKIMVNEEQISHVLRQLITNSIEASDATSVNIQISTGLMKCDESMFSQNRINEKLKPGVFAYVEVVDTGSGMNHITLQRAFDPFFTTKFLGRGLGLSFVQGIMRSHFGGILITSTLGQGTRIRLIFPMIETPRVATEPALTATIKHEKTDSTTTILVVDDDDMVRNVCAIYLQSQGFETMTAVDGEEALVIFAENSNKIDLVILDWKLPGMNGIQTFEEMRRLRPDVNALLISGYFQEDIYPEFKDKGLSGYLQKPFTFEELQAEVNAILKNS